MSSFERSGMNTAESRLGAEGRLCRLQRREDPFADLYDEERVVFLSDEWANPDVCLKLEGAIPGT
jgi:hypothetical protein